MMVIQTKGATVQYTRQEEEAGLPVQSGVVAGVDLWPRMQQCLMECQMDRDCMKECFPPLPNPDFPTPPHHM